MSWADDHLEKTSPQADDQLVNPSGWRCRFLSNFAGGWFPVEKSHMAIKDHGIIDYKWIYKWWI